MLLLLTGLRFYFWRNVTGVDLNWVFFTSINDFVLLLFIIGVVAISGYLINDVLDVDSDKVNKPKKQLAFSRSLLIIIYLIFNVFVCVLSIFCLANSTVIKIIFGANVLLFLYSFLFQKLPLIGNIVVSILSGILPLLFYYYNPIIHKYHYFYSDDFYLFYIISFYSYLGFGITLIRELIKDIEDIEGDKVANYRTFPIVAGVKASQIMFYTFTLVFLVGLFFLDGNLFNHFLFNHWVYYMPTLVFLLIAVIEVVKTNFSKASLFLKLTLFSGVLILFIL